MGVTIGNTKRSIDMSYHGFYRLRSRVAHLINEELGMFYDELYENMKKFGKEREELMNAYDERLANADEEFNVSEELLDFLYDSDCGGKVTPKQCRQIYKIIKDYDDDNAYGYTGRKDCAKFSDFKELVYDCARRNVHLRWY